MKRVESRALLLQGSAVRVIRVPRTSMTGPLMNSGCCGRHVDKHAMQA